MLLFTSSRNCDLKHVDENSENFVPQPTSGKAFKDMFEIVIDEFVHKCKQDILPTYDV